MARERGIMKRFYNYTFKTVCIYIMILSVFSISSFGFKTGYSSIHNSNLEKLVISNILTQSDEEENNILEEESINSVDKTETTKKDETVNNEEKEEPIEEPTKVEEVINIVDTSSYAVLTTETVNISHYGHDCYGCTTGKTASGYYVGDGKIYYQDSVFGSVRIVAADNKYPLGTIIRLGYNGKKITAIVLDRGGSIGDNNEFQIDLLAPSNSEALILGTVRNTSLEVLRLGY